MPFYYLKVDSSYDPELTKKIIKICTQISKSEWDRYFRRQEFRKLLWQALKCPVTYPVLGIIVISGMIFFKVYIPHCFVGIKEGVYIVKNTSILILKRISKSSKSFRKGFRKFIGGEAKKFVRGLKADIKKITQFLKKSLPRKKYSPSKKPKKDKK
jgi:hypothetical protein